MNRSKVFSTVKDHLLAQGQQALGLDGCLYKTHDNLRCAIGCLIPDDHPGLKSPDGVVGLLDDYPDLAELWEVKDGDIAFLNRLQGIHDNYSPVDWKEQLKFFEAELND